MNARLVKDFAKSAGAHLVGVASAEAFKEAPVGHRPSDLLENAESVVVVAMVIPLSIVKSIPSIHYNQCYRYLNEQLRLLAYRVAIFIESHGFEALPLDPSEPDYAREVRIIEGKPGLKVEILGSFSHRHAAVLAGLGEISAASYVVVPNFGPRIRLTSIVTSARLEPDPAFRDDFKWGLVCKPELCGFACVRTCPAKALPGNGTVNHFRCRSYRNPKLYTIEYFKRIASLVGVNPTERVSMLPREYLSSESKLCGLCLKACPIGTITR